MDILTGSGLVEQGGSFVLVEDAGLFLPDIEVFLADAQQHRNILGLNDVALFEAGPLELTRDDLGDIVAEHLSDCLRCLHKLHIIPLSNYYLCKY